MDATGEKNTHSHEGDRSENAAPPPTDVNVFRRRNYFSEVVGRNLSIGKDLTKLMMDYRGIVVRSRISCGSMVGVTVGSA